MYFDVLLQNISHIYIYTYFWPNLYVYHIYIYIYYKHTGWDIYDKHTGWAKNKYRVTILYTVH